MSGELPPIIPEGSSLNLATAAAKKVFSEYWAVLAALIVIFGPILWILFDFQGRISAQEAKLQLYIDLQQNRGKGD